MLDETLEKKQIPPYPPTKKKEEKKKEKTITAKNFNALNIDKQP